MRILAALALFFCLMAEAKTLTIAVIDTGIDRSNLHLCKEGHQSFVGGDPLNDVFGHGTHIAGLISRYAGEGDYCLVALKYYGGPNNWNNLDALRLAIRRAIDLKVDLINLSGGGQDPDNRERELVLEALNKGITVVVAAGNDGKNLDIKCEYFPACYDKRIVVVGNASNGKCGEPVDLSYGKPGSYLFRAPSSNYGKVVTRWEHGILCDSTLPNGMHGTMSGTSQSTAIVTGRLVKERLKGHR